MRTELTKLIRKAIDTLPDGINFSTESGRAVLSNSVMNDLMYTLTGNTIVDADHAWNELVNIERRNGCVKLHGVYIDDKKDIDDSEHQIFRFPDGKVWRFRKMPIKEEERTFTQIEANEITELYQLSQKLCEDKNNLMEQAERQKKLTEEIVKTNYEKERVSFKMYIHDELGRCTLASRQAFTEGTVDKESDQLIRLWERSIHNLLDISQEERKEESHPEVELRKVAGIIGCELDIQGDQPKSPKSLKLLYSAMRETLTNAVRHGNADKLTVRIAKNKTGYHVVIYDNGNVDKSVIVEGNGLGNLRKKLEMEGASMKITVDKKVILEFEIPEYD